MSPTEVLVAVAIVVGLVGVVVPFLPGSLLVLVAIVVWATETGGTGAWWVAGAATVTIGLGWVIKYAVPGNRLKAAGVPNSTLFVAGGFGLVGFFVIPVVGLVIGFVGGIYLWEYQRVGKDRAWPATKHALKAVGVSMLIEFTASVLAACWWIIGLVVT